MKYIGISNMENNKQFFSDIPLYNWKEMLFAKIFGTKYVTNSEMYKTTWYYFKGRIYIDKIEEKNAMDK